MSSSAPGKWKKIADYSDFIKWQYKESPYRIVAHINDRGHWESRFVTTLDTRSYLVRGNCGGEAMGRLKALSAAEKFMDDNPYGCAPPAEM